MLISALVTFLVVILILYLVIVQIIVIVIGGLSLLWLLGVWI